MENNPTKINTFSAKPIFIINKVNQKEIDLNKFIEDCSEEYQAIKEILNDYHVIYFAEQNPNPNFADVNNYDVRFPQDADDIKMSEVLELVEHTLRVQGIIKDEVVESKKEEVKLSDGDTLRHKRFISFDYYPDAVEKFDKVRVHGLTSFDESDTELLKILERDGYHVQDWRKFKGENTPFVRYKIDLMYLDHIAGTWDSAVINELLVKNPEYMELLLQNRAIKNNKKVIKQLDAVDCQGEYPNKRYLTVDFFFNKELYEIEDWNNHIGYVSMTDNYDEIREHLNDYDKFNVLGYNEIFSSDASGCMYRYYVDMITFQVTTFDALPLSKYFEKHQYADFVKPVSKDTKTFNYLDFIVEGQLATSEPQLKRYVMFKRFNVDLNYCKIVKEHYKLINNFDTLEELKFSDNLVKNVNEFGYYFDEKNMFNLGKHHLYVLDLHWVGGFNIGAVHKFFKYFPEFNYYAQQFQAAHEYLHAPQEWKEINEGTPAPELESKIKSFTMYDKPESLDDVATDLIVERKQEIKVRQSQSDYVSKFYGIEMPVIHTAIIKNVKGGTLFDALQCKAIRFIYQNVEAATLTNIVEFNPMFVNIQYFKDFHEMQQDELMMLKDRSHTNRVIGGDVVIWFTPETYELGSDNIIDAFIAYSTLPKFIKYDDARVEPILVFDLYIDDYLKFKNKHTNIISPCFEILENFNKFVRFDNDFWTERWIEKGWHTIDVVKGKIRCFLNLNMFKVERRHLMSAEDSFVMDIVEDLFRLYPKYKEYNDYILNAGVVEVKQKVEGEYIAPLPMTHQAPLKKLFGKGLPELSNLKQEFVINLPKNIKDTENDRIVLDYDNVYFDPEYKFLILEHDTKLPMNFIGAKITNKITYEHLLINNFCSAPTQSGNMTVTVRIFDYLFGSNLVFDEFLRRNTTLANRLSGKKFFGEELIGTNNQVQLFDPIIKTNHYIVFTYNYHDKMIPEGNISHTDFSSVIGLFSIPNDIHRINYAGFYVDTFETLRSKTFTVDLKQYKLGESTFIDAFLNNFATKETLKQFKPKK